MLAQLAWLTHCCWLKHLGMVCVCHVFYRTPFWAPRVPFGFIACKRCPVPARRRCWPQVPRAWIRMGRPLSVLAFLTKVVPGCICVAARLLVEAVGAPCQVGVATVGEKLGMATRGGAIRPVSGGANVKGELSRALGGKPHGESPCGLKFGTRLGCVRVEGNFPRTPRCSSTRARPRGTFLDGTAVNFTILGQTIFSACNVCPRPLGPPLVVPSRLT